MNVAILRGFCVSVLLLAGSAAAARNELRPDTLQAWNVYLQTAETRAVGIAAKRGLPAEEGSGPRDQLRAGRIAVFNVAGDSSKRPPHATLQDWTGAVFIPGATLDDVFSIVLDYGHYADYYGPVIRNSRLLERGDGVQKYRLRYVRKALFAVMAFDIDYESFDCRVTDRHWYSLTRSTAVHQIKNFGEPDERSLPVDDRDTFLWRAAGSMQFDESDGGVYISQESIILGHPVPVAWRWLVDPFVDRLARQLVTGWLRQTRDASIAASRSEGAQKDRAATARSASVGTAPGCRQNPAL